MNRISLAGLLLLLSSAVPPSDDTYEATLRGASCSAKEDFLDRKAIMDCEYRVGKSLWFAIPGIGADDAAITFFRADSDGDYYATVGVGVLHQCVVVKPGSKRKPDPTDFAFVSPRNGRVYRTWQDCAKA